MECERCYLYEKAINTEKELKGCDLNSFLRFIKGSNAYDPTSLWCLLNMGHCLNGDNPCRLTSALLI